MQAWYRSWGLCLLFGLCGFLPQVWADPQRSEPPPDVFQDGDTVVFFGDSITQGGLYIDHVEAFLLTRFPEKKLTVYNRGISSETISGTSEADHDPRRPWAHERFTRDITPLKPQVLIACFGMNDGNYHPFEWTRFEKYQQGVRRLMQRAREEAGVRTLILMTPPPFDPYQRKAGDPQAKEFGYKYAAINYDETLARYSSWLLSLRSEGVLVVDLHGTINRHVQQRRQEQVSFTVAPDAVHPNMTGHWLMALQFVRQVPGLVRPQVNAWNGPLGVEPAQFPARVTGLAPVDPQVDAVSYQLERPGPGDFGGIALHWPQANHELNYELLLDGQSFRKFPGRELQRGVTIPPQADVTALQQRQTLLKKVRERRSLEYWQFRAGTDKPLGNKPPVADIPARLAELTAEIEALRQPVAVTVELRPGE